MPCKPLYKSKHLEVPTIDSTSSSGRPPLPFQSTPGRSISTPLPPSWPLPFQPTPGRSITTPLPPSWEYTSKQIRPPLPLDAWAAHSSKDIAKFVYHRHYGKKKAYWNLAPSRSIQILGDSNLARLPSIHHSNVEIHSFPGSTLQHALHILQHRTLISAGVTKVLLCFGLNNRKEDHPPRNTAALHALLAQAHTTFPGAEIWTAAITFGGGLSLGEQIALDHLNHTIQSFLHHIPPLPANDFEVMTDQIHWSQDTGIRMWTHFAFYLNG